MKAKVWNLSNLPARNNSLSGPSISMSPKSGVLSYSKALIEKFNLSENVKLNFIQDEDRPQDWYIEVSEDPLAIPVYRKKNAEGVADSLVSRSTALVKTIFNSLGIEAEHFRSHSFPVATEPTGGGNLYAIITKAIKK